MSIVESSTESNTESSTSEQPNIPPVQHDDASFSSFLSIIFFNYSKVTKAIKQFCQHLDYNKPLTDVMDIFNDFFSRHFKSREITEDDREYLMECYFNGQNQSLFQHILLSLIPL
jgi:hypothetical protein